MNDSIGNVRKTLTRFQRNGGKLTHLSTASFATFMMLSIRRSTNIHVQFVIDLLLIEKKNHFYFHRLFTAWLALSVCKHVACSNEHVLLHIIVNLISLALTYLCS